MGWSASPLTRTATYRRWREDGCREGWPAGEHPLPAQPTSARQRLGQHGALSGASHAVGGRPTFFKPSGLTPHLMSMVRAKRCWHVRQTHQFRPASSSGAKPGSACRWRAGSQRRLASICGRKTRWLRTPGPHGPADGPLRSSNRIPGERHEDRPHRPTRLQGSQRSVLFGFQVV